MVDNAIQKTINDEIFETVYYHKFLDEICSTEEYKTLENILSDFDYTTRFYYCKDQSWLSTTYYVEFEILDCSRNLIYVPKTSCYYDVLYSLGGSGCALIQKKIPRKTIVCLDKEELRDDFKKITEYLLSIKECLDN